VGFEPTITASQRAKIVYALDSSATVTGFDKIICCEIWVLQNGGYEVFAVIFTLSMKG
jgi:hypothetical protein